MEQCHHKGTQETPDLTQTEGKGDKTRRRMASEQQINRVSGLLVVKMI